MKSLKVFTVLPLDKSTVRKFRLEDGDNLVSIEKVQNAVEMSIPLSLASDLKDLNRKFGPWLKNNKDLSKYDIFVSYYGINDDDSVGDRDWLDYGAKELEEDKELAMALVDMISNFSYGSKFRAVNVYLGQHVDPSQNVKFLSKSTIFIPVFSVGLVNKMMKQDSSKVDLILLEWICALEGLKSKKHSRINVIFPLKRDSSTDKLLSVLNSEEFNDSIPHATLDKAEILLIQLKFFSKVPNGFHSKTVKSIVTEMSEYNKDVDIVDDKSSNLLKSYAKKVIEILEPVNFTKVLTV